MKKLNYEQAFRYLLMGQHRIYGFPRTSASQVQSAQSIGPLDELRHYRHLRKSFGRVQVMILILSLLLTIKNLFLLYFTTNSIIQLEKDLDCMMSNGVSCSNDDVISFGCLRTTCRSRNLLMALPVFSLCYPNLRHFYLPISDLQTIGLMMYTIYALIIAVFGFGAPFYLNLKPIVHELLMYLLAPGTGRNLKRKQMKAFMNEIYVSTSVYFGYQSAKRGDQKPKVGQKTQAHRSKSLGFTALASPSLIDREACAQIYLNHAKQRMLELGKNFEQLGRAMREFIDDSITLFRGTDLYRLTVIRQYILLTIFFIMICFVALVLCLGWVYVEIIGRNTQLKNIKSTLWKRNCSIWYDKAYLVGATGDSNTVLPVDIASIVPIGWTLVPAVEFFFVSSLILFLGGTMLAAFFVIARELHDQIYEQLYKIDMVIEMCDLMQDLMPRNSGERRTMNSLDFIGKNADHLASYFNFRNLKRSIEVKLVTIFDTSRLGLFGNVDHELRHLTRRLATGQLISRGVSIGAITMLLHKIYCGNRALMVYTRESSRNLSTALLLTMTSNFSIILAVMFVNNTFDESSLLLMIFVTYGVLANTFIIFYPAKCQATSKRIISMMWRLLSTTLQFDDVRIKHVRIMYLKQLQVLCQEDGLTLYAFEIPVRYESLIKLLLWSSTLTVLAFNGKFRPMDISD